jgi:HEAT repeat protein
MGLFGPPNVEKMKASKNVQGLIKALGYQKDCNVRIAAAQALGEIGAPRAVGPLIAALKDENGYVRKAAAEALVEIDALAVEPLIAALKGEKGYVRIAAAKALGEIGDSRAVEPLIFAVHKDRYVREAATTAMGKIGDPRAVESLIAVLKTGDMQVRKAAAEALDKIGWLPDEGVNGVVYWIAKKEWDRCVKIGAPSVEPLNNALNDEDSDVRKASVAALGQIGDPRAVGPLIAALKDENWYVRKAAAIALDKIGWLPDEGATGAAYWIVKEEWDRCVKIGAPAVEPLIASFIVSLWWVRKAAAEALVGLYQSGRLDSKCQQLILSKREMIERKHEDWVKHACFSDIKPTHHDNMGTGISFPV